MAAVELEVLGGRERPRTCARRRAGRGGRAGPRRRARGLERRGASRSRRVRGAPRGRCRARRRRTRRARAACRYERRNSSTPAAVQPSWAPGITRRTMPSTTGRGRGWSRPSSGRTRRTSGAHGRSAQPRQRRRQEAEPPDALGMAEADLERHPAAHAVPDQVGAVELSASSSATTARAKKRGVVGRRHRLGGVAEARQVERDRRGTGRPARRPWAGTRPSSRRARGAARRAARCPPATERPECPSRPPRAHAAGPGSYAPLVAARKPTPRWRSPRIPAARRGRRPSRRARRARCAPTSRGSADSRASGRWLRFGGLERASSRGGSRSPTRRRRRRAAAAAHGRSGASKAEPSKRPASASRTGGVAAHPRQCYPIAAYPQRSPMSELENRTRYEPAEVESRVFERWEEAGLFHPEPTGTAEENYSIAVPPPNVTGALHMGHALNGSIQDVLIRLRAHARPAHQVDLRHRPRRHRHPAPGREGARRARARAKEELGREAFIERVWEWREQYGSHDHRAVQARSGASLDYEDERFTMDDGYARAVLHVFVRPVREGPDLPRQLHGQLGPRACARRSPTSRSSSARSRTRSTTIDYPLESGSGSVTVATVRPETMLADTAIAVNPDDERYSRLIGETAILPLVGPAAADHRRRVRRPGVRHRRAEDHARATTRTTSRSAAATGSRRSRVIGEDGRMTDAGRRALRAAWTVDEAREAVVAALREEGLISAHRALHARRAALAPLGRADRAADLAPVVLRHGRAGRAGDRGRARRRACASTPSARGRRLPRLAREHPPLVHLAPALVGPPAPGLVPRRARPTWACEPPRGRRLGARPGRARHLVLVGLWPFATLGWPEDTPRAARLLPDRRALDGARHHLPLGRPHGDVRASSSPASCRSPT